MSPIAEYELSPRERHITQLVARGLGTAEIASPVRFDADTVERC